MNAITIWGCTPVLLAWLAAGLLQLAMLLGEYLVAGNSPLPHLSPVESLAWTAAKLAMVTILAALILFRWRTRLIRLLRWYACRWNISGGGAALLLAGLAAALVLMADWALPRLHMEELPAVPYDAAQTVAILLLICVLALAAERSRSRPPLGVLEAVTTATGLTLLALFLAAGLPPFQVSLPLVLMTSVLIGRFPRDPVIYVGVTATLLMGVAAVSPYRRDRLARLFSAFFGPPDACPGPYQWEKSCDSLCAAATFGPTEAIAPHIPGGNDELLLAAVMPYFGLAPALLLATAITGVSLWAWLKCFNARVHGGRNVLRNIGLAASSLFLFVATPLSLAANFRLLPMVYEFGVSYYSPRLSMLILGATSLLAASLMPHARANSISGRDGPSVRRSLVIKIAGALSLGVWAWMIMGTREHSLGIGFVSLSTGSVS